MNNEELIRRGNVLIAAARDGKIGLSEEELKGLQKCYLQREKMGDRIKDVRTAGYIFAVCGFVMLYCGGLLFGIIGGLCGVFQIVNMNGLEMKARQYADVVNHEYPKLPKKDAA